MHQLEPGENHRPVPRDILTARAAIAFHWGWHRTSLLLLLGFWCMRRPAELLSVRIEDLELSSDKMFMVVRSTKPR